MTHQKHEFWSQRLGFKLVVHHNPKSRNPKKSSYQKYDSGKKNFNYLKVFIYIFKRDLFQKHRNMTEHVVGYFTQ